MSIMTSFVFSFLILYIVFSKKEYIYIYKKLYEKHSEAHSQHLT